MTSSSQTENHDTQAIDQASPGPKQHDQEGCCGGPSPKDTEACCALDAELKTAGRAGCGCAPQVTSGTRAPRRCC